MSQQEEQQVPDPVGQGTGQFLAQASALPGQQLQQARFPYFNRFPTEIQGLIFTEAIGKPNIHVVRAIRRVDHHLGTWHLDFAPVQKREDKSGFRGLINLAAVSQVAHGAVHLATLRDGTRLPFKALVAYIDHKEDLVVVDMPNSTSPVFGYFHGVNQILNPAGGLFNSNNLAVKFSNIQKVALKYSQRHHTAHSIRANFRCPRVTDEHVKHQQWHMCPEELCGFLNCFPSLREFYIVYEKPRCRFTQEYIGVYIKNFYTLPATSPLRRSLAQFHAADHSYIEVHPRLMFLVVPASRTVGIAADNMGGNGQADVAAATAADQPAAPAGSGGNNDDAQAGSRAPAAPAAPAPADNNNGGSSGSGGSAHLTIRPMVIPDLADVLPTLLRDLRTHYLVRDADPALQAYAREAWRVSYRLGLAARQALVCKVLVVARDEDKVGWPAEGEEARVVREYLAGV